MIQEMLKQRPGEGKVQWEICLRISGRGGGGSKGGRLSQNLLNSPDRGGLEGV